MIQNKTGWALDDILAQVEVLVLTLGKRVAASTPTAKRTKCPSPPCARWMTRPRRRRRLSRRLLCGAAGRAACSLLRARRRALQRVCPGADRHHGAPLHLRRVRGSLCRSLRRRPGAAGAAHPTAGLMAANALHRPGSMHLAMSTCTFSMSTVMNTVMSTDTDTLRRILYDDPVWAAYAIADLQPAYAEQAMPLVYGRLRPARRMHRTGDALRRARAAGALCHRPRCGGGGESGHGCHGRRAAAHGLPEHSLRARGGSGALVCACRPRRTRRSAPHAAADVAQVASRCT